MDRALSRSGKAGVTLVEVMLASVILLFLTLSLFEGLTVAARIARENRETLEADAYAFDHAMLVLNKEFPSTSSEIPETPIKREYVPSLYRDGWSTPKVRVHVRLNGELKTEATNTVIVTYGTALEPKKRTCVVVQGNIARTSKATTGK